MIGLGCVFMTALCYSTVGVVTRHLSSIHFSVMLFHLSWSSTLILGSYLAIDYLSSDLSVPRLLTYDTQMYIICLLASAINAVGMNFLTIAW